MNNELINSEPELKKPVFRVIGYGEETRQAIDEINALGYDGVEALVVTDHSHAAPCDGDKMVIVLTAGNRDGIVDLLKQFYQGGVLTLLISSEDFPVGGDVCDSRTVVEYAHFRDTVSALIGPLLLPGKIDYDFNDQASILRKTGRFVTCTSIADGGDNRIADALTSISARLSSVNGIERLAFVISYNPATDSPLKTREILPLTEYLKTYPDSVEMMWGVKTDEKLGTSAMRLTLLASGKELGL